MIKNTHATVVAALFFLNLLCRLVISRDISFLIIKDKSTYKKEYNIFHYYNFMNLLNWLLSNNSCSFFNCVFWLAILSYVKLWQLFLNFLSSFLCILLLYLFAFHGFFIKNLCQKIIRVILLRRCVRLYHWLLSYIFLL